MVFVEEFYVQIVIRNPSHTREEIFVIIWILRRTNWTGTGVIRRVKIRIARDVSAFLSLTMKSYSLQCDAMKLLYNIGGPF